MIAGIDYSSFQIDIVLLDDEADTATWHPCPLPGKTPFDRARAVRHRFPTLSWWDDQGVYLVAIEDPYSQANHTAKALGLIAGAIACRLPPQLTVIHTAPSEWKRLAVGKPSASKAEVTRWARVQLEHGYVSPIPPSDMVTKWSEHAYDAYSIARAVRVLNNQAIEKAGAL